MGKKTGSSAAVRAVLQFDPDAMDKVVLATSAGDPNREIFLAMAEALRARSRGAKAVEDSIRALSALLEPAPLEPGLLQVLLLLIVRLSCPSGRIGDASRAMRLLDGIGGAGSRDPDMAINILLARSNLLFTMGNVDASRETCDRAIALAGPRTDRLACLCHALRIQIATTMDDYRSAERHWALVEKHPWPGLMAFSWNYIKGRVLRCAGHNAEALAVFESIPKTVTEEEHEAVLAERIEMLFRLGRRAEAMKMLDGPGAELPSFRRARLEMRGALLANELDAAREHARTILTGSEVTPVMVQVLTLDLVHIELAARRPRSARLLLKANDPGESNPQHCIEWARLFLLEGREGLAAERFRRALGTMNAGLLRINLMTAHEISTAQLCRLWSMAELAASDGASPDAEATLRLPASAAPAWSEKGTNAVAPAAGAALVGSSPAMLQVKADIRRFAPLEETVLIGGETGTGKELVARLLHDWGPRAGRPFLAVNCAAISDTLLETELFGHVRGAFTGADRANDGLLVAAADGTLFFDEVGSMSPRVQASLLRVLEERRVRPVGGAKTVAIACRIVAATNQPLEELARAGQFRQDLLYRLARLEVKLPPLRARREDIPALARHFLSRFFDCGEVALGDDLLVALADRGWPGNVRELRNEVERIAILSGGEKILGAGLLRKGAEEPRGDEPAEAGPSVPPALTGTRGRMLRLRRLFDEHAELGRGDVVRLLGCAPATAARMLGALEGEGYLKRIWPTPAPRTSYFVRAGGG